MSHAARGVMPDNGVIALPSPSAFDETIERIERAPADRGLAVFCRIDHAGEAARVGLAMPPTTVLLFGNPRAGTPLMLAAPSAAIDLPLKVLVAEDGDGRVWVSYNSAAYLQERHGLSDELIAKVAAAGPVLEAAIG